ncbi:ribosomal dna transcription factor rrn3 [Moniliophthora roreri MCA 2997]|uniref:Ribosomal dna transcription factor rrn3 n=1 Tax=Moniliophthora roreri (strain MCA 2997) TaxID=1381753 RepID=V2XN27_MONRO|nr:ribosomal dna transcription factor rrn3 [Moniliophthora roreri MCA 2997]
MDVHSRFSQFDNQSKRTKAGPQATKPRIMADSSPKAQLPRKTSNAASSSSANASLFIRRPIATNSRVKQDEKTRKDMYLSFVNNALHQKSLGITEPFDELVNQFNPKRSPTELPFPQPAQLRLWILALSHVVSRLERTHVALVESIVNMPWVTMDTATVKSYTVFIGVLLSARPEYLSLVLSKIAQGFTYQSDIQTVTYTSPDSPSTSTSPPLTRRIIYDRLHYLLRHLLSLIPTLPSTLMPLLTRNFPHKRQNTRSQSTYIKNLLRVSAYCPELADGILELVIDRAIQIDVQIQVEIDDIEDDIDDSDNDNANNLPSSSAEIFDIDLDTVVGQESSDTSDSDSDDGDDADSDFSDLSSEFDFDDDERKAELPMNVKHIAEMVKKLDAILTLLFGHLDKVAGSFNSALSISKQMEPPLPATLPELPPLDLPTPTVLTPIPIVDIYAQTRSLSSPASSRASTPVTPSTSDATSLTPSLSSGNTTSEETSSTHTRQMHFHTLLSIFDRLILRTFKSRYTQFLLFWYTSLDAEFADIFLGMLVDRSLYASSLPSHTHNPQEGQGADTITRTSAASYIGSFVSRANFVDKEGTRRVVGILCEWLEAHLILPHTHTHTQQEVFYAVAQAVFLIFCFRWRDLLVESEEEDADAPSQTEDTPTAGPGPGQKWLPELAVVQRVVMSPLNPLRAISQAVAKQFAKVAHATGFLYVYSIMESNKRTTEDGGTGTGTRHPGQNGVQVQDLNTFFPFDPYGLPRSGRYIEEKYRAWRDVAIDEESEDEDEDEEDEEDGEEEKEEVQMNVSTSVPPDDGLGVSFGAMSISPARQGMVAMEALGTGS